MKTFRILSVVDYQTDFVDPNGALPVPNAMTLHQNIQEQINSGDYDHIIYTFDTHTPEEYNGSDEQKLFPNIHCEWGTPGWNFYKIKPQNNDDFQALVKNNSEPFVTATIGNESFFTKNVFDIWQGNAQFPKWFTDKFPVGRTEVDEVGVATNYCVFMNVSGMVERGYKVNVLSNAVEGIKAFPDGTIDPSFNANIEAMKNSGVNFV